MPRDPGTGQPAGPANVDILLNLAGFMVCVTITPPPNAALNKPSALHPRKAEMLTAIAKRAGVFRTQSLEENYLRRAAEQADVTPETCTKLAGLYERLRRLPEAAELVERALKLNPAFPAALVVRARLERQAGRLEAAEQVLRSFITKSVPDPWVPCPGLV